MWVVLRWPNDLDGCGLGSNCGEPSENKVENLTTERIDSRAELQEESHSKVVEVLQSDIFLRGHQHSVSSLQSTFFDFPTNAQLLMCYTNSGFTCWRFEHKPSKSFAIPSLQIYPYPLTVDNSGSLTLANHIFLITFISGSLECRRESMSLLTDSFENGKSQEHLNNT